MGYMTHPSNRTQRIGFLVLVPVIAALIGTVIYLRGGRVVETENAYLKADKVPVNAEISGVVKEVLVTDNQVIKAGDVLFRLDPAPTQIARAKAEAKLMQVRADLAALKAAYRTKQAEINLAKSKHQFALKEQARQAELLSKNFVSASKFDEAKQNSELAAMQVVALQQDLQRIAESLSGDVNAPVEKHPSFLSAQAELDQNKLDLSRIEVRAAVPGTVNKAPKLGQFVPAGSMVMALVANGNIWIEANLTETDLTYVRAGQPVKIHIDTYPDVVWQGEVESLSGATGSEFALIPAQNASGNWIKVAQRVAVKITIKPQPQAPELRTGLSTKVEIDTGHRRSLFGIAL
jgi:membrane fusion protein (multidrug efflux system)